MTNRSEINLEQFGVMKAPAACHVGFFLPDTFAMIPFVSAIEPLRVANRLVGKSLYRWSILSRDGESAMACNGMTQKADYALKALPKVDLLVVAGAHEPSTFKDRSVWALLKQYSEQKTTIGAMDTGAFLLAQAGLLDGYRCTIHWENMPGFVETFPHLVVSHELFEADRDRVTCAGGVAAMDMMLHMIAQQHGQVLAAQVCDVFIHTSIRSGHEPQRMNLSFRTGISNRKMLDCIELMEANIEQPLQSWELAGAVGISKRQLERLFKRYFDNTPSRYYLDLRLRKAQQLLKQTSLPIIEVAIACGFSSASHFSQSYRTLYGHSPREARQRDDYGSSST